MAVAIFSKLPAGASNSGMRGPRYAALEVKVMSVYNGKMVAEMPFYRAGETEKTVGDGPGCARQEKDGQPEDEKAAIPKARRDAGAPAVSPFAFDRPPFKLLFMYCFDSR
jgi:hypothetical protein